jgi:hypothetical protein
VAVKKGETINGVAKQWTMTGEQFRQINGLQADAELAERKSVRVFQKEIAGIKTPDLVKTMRRNAKQVKKCYEELVRRVPNKSGTMIVNLEIDRSGSVNSVTYSNSTLDDARAEACIAEDVSTWKFTNIEAFDVVTVEVPFIFKIVPKKK